MSDPVIVSRRLCFNYGSFRAVKDLSLEVNKGEIISVTGANGAGKTTLIKMLSGILTPLSGEVMIAGYNVTLDKKNAIRHIGYMSQTSALLTNLSASENYKFYGIINGFSRREIERKFAGDSDLFNMERFGNKRVEELTAGWKQLLSFAITIMKEPEVLLLDEPTAGVDAVTRVKIWDRIKELSSYGAAVVITSHYSSEASMCHRNINIQKPEQ